ncbi:MAG TPA: HD domain-containing protein [Bacteroidales bacterium]|nr:HD domain-containing protein [Bacteroidales bacterium]HPT02368.1 HD domain-containing protein [Bacteroidales bacterium]
MPNKRKIINDPLHGFITVPDELTFDVIEHRYFQRLRRIKQLGFTSMVYPGALHTRFHHALGAMHLMRQAIETLRIKGFRITDDEAAGASLAILLHDVGHGPYSHALENCLVYGMNHEDITVFFLDRLNEEFEGKLETAIRIFKDEYPEKFLHQLISGQLDVDRLDYLMRDSFFTGVSEGVISTDRIIKMLTLVDGEIAVEGKGIYSIEKFVVARRLMYWQVYFHKTVLAAEYTLLNILRRAKYLSERGAQLFATPAFSFFLSNHITADDFRDDRQILELFSQLDDFDIFSAIKVWTSHEDRILSMLSRALVYRNLPRVELQSGPFDDSFVGELKKRQKAQMQLSDEDLDYFIFTGSIANDAYIPFRDKINIVDKQGHISDIAMASDQLNVAILSKTVTKYFICYPKSIGIKEGRSNG